MTIPTRPALVDDAARWAVEAHCDLANMLVRLDDAGFEPMPEVVDAVEHVAVIAIKLGMLADAIIYQSANEQKAAQA